MSGTEDDRRCGPAGSEPIYRKRFDVSGCRAISLAIVEAVESVLNEEAAVHRSLYEVIDPDAIDRLFRPRENGLPRANGSVRFPLDGHEIRVEAIGLVEVYSLDPTDGIDR